MENKYVFIIWDKALFCKNKIMNDIKKDLKVVNSFYIKWEEKEFINNLKALYGIKTNNYYEKIKYVGNGPFYVVFVENNNPIFKERENFNGKVLVNNNIYDKKWLYRKWTAGNFRVHASVDEKETIHDLVVLLGTEYKKIINETKTDSTISINTSGVKGFSTTGEMENALRLFGNCVINDKKILSYSKQDVVDFLNAEKNNSNTYVIRIKNDTVEYQIYGVFEGDIPQALYDVAQNNKNILQEFSKLVEKHNIDDNEIINYYNTHNIELSFHKKEDNKISEEKSLLRRSIDVLKYYYLRFING